MYYGPGKVESVESVIVAGCCARMTRIAAGVYGLFRAFETLTKSRYFAISSILRQPSCPKTGEMRSDFLASVTILAAKFINTLATFGNKQTIKRVVRVSPRLLAKVTMCFCP